MYLLLFSAIICYLREGFNKKTLKVMEFFILGGGGGLPDFGKKMFVSMKIIKMFRMV